MDTQSAVAGGDSQTGNFGGDAFNIVSLTADIVSSYVGSANNHIGPEAIPALISSVHGSLSGLSGGNAQPEAKQEPFVSIRSSVKPDFIVCLEDGKKLKMLKRYLKTQYNMTPDQYRQKWGLAADYPMVAPNYAEQRRTLAKSIGLGTKRTRSTGTGNSAGAVNADENRGGRGRGRKANASNNGGGTASRGGRKASGSTTSGKIDGRSKEARAAKAAAGAKGGRASGGRGRKAANA
jgi:predicted transcriptional regulator